MKDRNIEDVMFVLAVSGDLPFRDLTRVSSEAGLMGEWSSISIDGIKSHIKRGGKYYLITKADRVNIPSHMILQEGNYRLIDVTKLEEITEPEEAEFYLNYHATQYFRRKRILGDYVNTIPKGVKWTFATLRNGEIMYQYPQYAGESVDAAMSRCVSAAKGFFRDADVIEAAVIPIRGKKPFPSAYTEYATLWTNKQEA